MSAEATNNKLVLILARVVVVVVYAVYAESLPDPNGLIYKEERRVRQ